MTTALVPLTEFVAQLADSPLAAWTTRAPWEITSRAHVIVRAALDALAPGDYLVSGDVAVHRTAQVEVGAVLKGPLVIGARCLVAAGAYLRGGNWLAADCIVGPGSELKSSFVFAGSKLAHFNFVGDSILGSDVNLEAGSIICNFRNERADQEILVRIGGTLQRTGCEKFGALIGDHARIGGNAVLAPGALLSPRSVVARGALRDDERGSP